MGFLKKWCDSIWLKVMYLIGLILLVLAFAYWNTWTPHQRMVALNAILLPAHVFEEWQFPAGFHYMYNLAMGSSYPERYPMSRLSDMITNFVGEIFFLLLLLFYSTAGSTFGLTLFSFIEVVVHSALGAKMKTRFSDKGKRTIYGPGSLTAYAGFFPIGIYGVSILLREQIGWNVIVPGLIILAAMLIGMIVIPENMLKRTDSPYPFPSPGYFAKFLD